MEKETKNEWRRFKPKGTEEEMEELDRLMSEKELFKKRWKYRKSNNLNRCQKREWYNSWYSNNFTFKE